MNETLSDFIKLAAVLALAAALVMMGFRIYNANKEATNKSIEQTARMTAQIQDTEFTQYENGTVTGSEVLAVIERMESADIWVFCQDVYFIYDGTYSTGDYTGELRTKQPMADLRAHIADAKDKSNSTTYISTSALYSGHVVRDEGTDAIVGLAFEPLYK